MSCDHISCSAKTFPDLINISILSRSVGSTKHIHLVGECLIPVHITRHIIAYKYVVVSRKSKTATEYEYIIDASYGGVVNRALDLPEDLRGKARGL